MPRDPQRTEVLRIPMERLAERYSSGKETGPVFFFLFHNFSSCCSFSQTTDCIWERLTRHFPAVVQLGYKELLQDTGSSSFKHLEG